MMSVMRLMTLSLADSLTEISPQQLLYNILMIMLQKMHLTLCVLTSVGTDLNRLSTTHFFLPGIVVSLAYLLIIN